MTLKKKCPYCEVRTIAKRLTGYYIGSELNVKLWECRECFGLWSNKTSV